MGDGPSYSNRRPRTHRPIGPGLCPRCGAITVSRVGKYGEFYGCIKYPDCKGTRENNS